MQRVLLARALLRNPDLLVLDEPAQGVDVTGQADLYETIGRIRDSRGCGVLMVSHDLHLVMSATDTVLCLNNHVCCAGHPETVSADPAYVSLFGAKVAETLALYHHHHDHHHDLHGEVVEDEHEGAAMDDFMVRAFAAALGVALVASPFGCFVVWRRMAYFGDTLAHSALLGVALGLGFDLDPTLGIIAASFVIAVLLAVMQKNQDIAADTLLGIMSHGALAVGMVALAFLDNVRLDLMAYLFGDILAVSLDDVIWIWCGGAVVLAGLGFLWRPLLSMTVHEDLAQVEGVNVGRVRIVLMLLIALVIATAMKVVGVLLVTSLLIIPAATARQMARTPEQMALIACGVGALGAFGGLWGAVTFDTPAGPSIVVVSVLLFLTSRIGRSVSAR